MISRQSTSALAVGVVASLSLGALVWWLQASTGPGIILEARLTDEASETEAGTLGSPSGGMQPPADIEGAFRESGGTPGKSPGAWPGFRGSNFSNIESGGAPLADSWPESGPPVLWSIKLGEGYAGAAVLNGRVFLIDYDEEEESDALRCLSLDDGKEIWRRWYHSPTKKNHGISRTVPAVTEDYVVSIGPKCHVLCVDMESGDFRWGIDMVAEYGSEVPLWYTGQCPLIDDGVAVLAPVGNEILMMGVDCESGEVLWETPNNHGWEMSHSSPIPMTLLGKKMYVYCAVGGIVGVSAEAEDLGAILWESTAWNHKVMAPSPVAIEDDRIFLAAGYGGGSMMLALEERDGVFTAEPLFTLEKTVFGSEQQSPVYYDGHIYGILPKDAKELNAQFVCMTTDGKIQWSSGKTERFGLGPYLFADKKIFLLSDHGELTLIEASLEGYHQLARTQVLHGHDAWAPMALVDGRLLLRDFEEMVCLDVSKTH